MSVEDDDKEQIDLLNKLNGINPGKITVEKRFPLNNTGLFSATEKVIDSFKSNIIATKNPDKIPTSEPTNEPRLDPTVFGTTKPTKKIKPKFSALTPIKVKIRSK